MCNELWVWINPMFLCLNIIISQYISLGVNDIFCLGTNQPKNDFES